MTTLDAIDDILARGDDADDVLRAVVETLASSPGATWAEVLFLEDGDLVHGPSVGDPDPEQRTREGVVYQGQPVGELAVDGDVQPELVQAIAERISPYVLLGWDTGGEAWEP